MAILFYLACLLIGVLPVVAIGLPWWGSFIIILILQFIPASAAIFWVWGLIVTIGGPQDWFAIIYYILTVVMFIPFIINVLGGLLKKK